MVKFMLKNFLGNLYIALIKGGALVQYRFPYYVNMIQIEAGVFS